MHPSALLGMLALASATLALPSSPFGPSFPFGSTHVSGSHASIQNFKSKIKNVVLLCMENRSLDNLLGGQTHPGIENPIKNGPYCNPYNVSDISQGYHCTEPRDYDSVKNDPSHDVTGNTMEFFSQWTPDNEAIAKGWLTPNNNGFITEQIHNYGSKVNKTVLARQVMNYYTEKQVPVMTSIVQNFLTFNHWHSDVAGPTDPNRFALVSGTSHGHGINEASDYTYNLPQMSIFQKLSEKGISWLNYWDPAGGTGPDSRAFTWTKESGNENKTVPVDQFYSDALSGNLPPFSYINPSCCGVGTTSMHDSGLISDGEAFLKKVYESLRAGPQWENTLFILTFDETGGFHDHVPPPLAPRPDDLTYTELAANGQNYTLDFNRLGGRLPTWLISPWITTGAVEQYGVNSYGEVVSYCASSVLRTLGYLWDFEPFNPRVEWAASFDHLIQREPQEKLATLPYPTNFTSYKLL